MSERHATGHLYVRRHAPTDDKPGRRIDIPLAQAREGEPVYARLRLPGAGRDGRDKHPNKPLGRFWTKRSNPPAGHVTKRQAQARLEAMLAGEDPTVILRPSHVTFGQACAEHMRYLEREQLCKASYLRDNRNTINGHLLPFIGAKTPVETITTERINELRRQLLERVSHKTASKVLILLHGILATAVREDWIRVNPAAKARKVKLIRSTEFNVLSVEAVEAVSRAAQGDGMPELIRTLRSAVCGRESFWRSAGGTSTSITGSFTSAGTSRQAR